MIDGIGLFNIETYGKSERLIGLPVSPAIGQTEIPEQSLVLVDATDISMALPLAVSAVHSKALQAEIPAAPAAPDRISELTG